MMVSGGIQDKDDPQDLVLQKKMEANRELERKVDAIIAAG
jgi:hypothetical protein